MIVIFIHKECYMFEKLILTYLRKNIKVRRIKNGKKFKRAIVILHGRKTKIAFRLEM